MNMDRETRASADGLEKPTANVHSSAAGNNVQEVTTASVALAAAVAEQKPSLWSRSSLHLMAILSVAYLVSTMSGYDGSLMGGINALDPFQKRFNLDGGGETTGIIFIVYNIGQITSFAFCGLLADGLGRRWCMFIGCVIVVIGTAIQTPATTRDQFIGGRFVLGFGASIASAAAPAYCVELAHPAYRGTMAGMYNNFWWLGNILAGWATYGANKYYTNDWAWRIPTLVQAGMPGIVALLVMFFPESPRWLIHHDRADEALAILAKYHGDGDPDSPLVRLQYREILEDYHNNTDTNPWWDYRELVRDRAARYRLMLVIIMSFWGQWSGNNVSSYFMPAMLENAGIESTSKQLILNAISPIFSMIAAVYGATCLDKLGRRPMMLGSLAGSCFFYILLTAFTAKVIPIGTIASIYLFNICFAWGMTALQTLYSVECLENRTRAKGSGLNYLFLNVAMVVNTFGIAVGMKRIGWRLYIVYVCWIVFEAVIIYFFFVETAGKTLEELDEIFQSPNPRKASTKKVKVTLDEEGRVVDGENQG